MKNILYLIKKWWIVAAIFIGFRSKDDLKNLSDQYKSPKNSVNEILLDEFEMNTYHS